MNAYVLVLHFTINMKGADVEFLHLYCDVTENIRTGFEVLMVVSIICQYKGTDVKLLIYIVLVQFLSTQAV